MTLMSSDHECESRQLVVRHDQLPALRESCEANKVMLNEGVKPATADVAKLKRPTTIIVSLCGTHIRVAAVRREVRI